jgi:hypothetical protein
LEGRVEAEWLHLVPRSRRQIVFDRHALTQCLLGWQGATGVMGTQCGEYPWLSTATIRQEAG